jgi:hypothetical protein
MRTCQLLLSISKTSIRSSGARRMRQHGRDGRALRRVDALSRPDVARRNHTQAGEWRTREAVVRARAGLIVDAEHGGLTLSMPPDCSGGRKFITVLDVFAGVGTDIVAPAHVAIHERDNAVSLALWRSEPENTLRFEASATAPVLTLRVHLVTPSRTASTVAKAAVTQNMFRRFDVTTGKSPDRSGAFNGLTFLGDLPCCRIAVLRAMVIPVSLS